jgi:hypothetical protein
LLSTDITPVYIDLQSAAVTNSEVDFCYSLVRAILRDVRSQTIELQAAQRDYFKASPFVALEEWLEGAITQLGNNRLLLCFDEFEKLGAAISEGRLSLRIFDELRHLIQHSDRIAFLFAGVQTLEELGPNWSSYFISVRPIELVYLEPDEARSVLIDPDPQFDMQYADGILEEIISYTNGHPYLLQLLGQALVEQANLQHIRIVTQDVLATAKNSALTSGEPYFINLWLEFTGTTPEEVNTGQAILKSLAHNQPWTENTYTNRILRRLVRHHVIRSSKTEQGFSYEVPMVEMWVRERAYDTEQD